MVSLPGAEEAEVEVLHTDKLLPRVSGDWCFLPPAPPGMGGGGGGGGGGGAGIAPVYVEVLSRPFCNAFGPS